MRFYSLEKLINLHDGYRKSFKIDQYNLVLIQIAGQLNLIESRCPHRGHPLVDAEIIGTSIRCPLHGYRFDMNTGLLKEASEEMCRNLKVYELVYQQTEVGIML